MTTTVYNVPLIVGCIVVLFLVNILCAYLVNVSGGCAVYATLIWVSSLGVAMYIDLKQLYMKPEFR